jgi:Ca-activated chloride channel homolog
MKIAKNLTRVAVPILCLLLGAGCRRPSALNHAATSPAVAGIDTVLSVPGCGPNDDPATQANPAATVAESGDDPFPLRSIAVRAEVSGPVAHVTIHEVFGNRNKVPSEAVYVFPLPHQAAVHGMSIRTKGKLVRAVIQRRNEARATYEEASRQGKTASLLEQQRPDVFTQSVANLMPGDTIGVELELDMPLAHAGEWTEFVFPTVVGPRFCPPGKVPDMGKIGAPRLPPGMVAPQTLDMQVRLDAGFPVLALESPTHCVASQGKRDGSQSWQGPVEVRLDHGAAVPDRDFVLRWKTRKASASATVLVDGNGKDGHFLLEIQPPAQSDATNATPKELVFLVDQSGSMGGEPIALVKRAMRKALETMEPRDKFQIIGFSNSVVKFAPQPVAASKANVAKGLSWVDGLSANGGTYMLDGVREAMLTPVDDNSLRILAMMTDGYIGNESEILEWVSKHLDHRTRTFAFGVGSAVNRSFLYEFGLAGGGKTEFVTLDEDPAVAVERFRGRIDRPVLTDVQLDWHGLDVATVTPMRIPDLFAGEPLLITGKFKSAASGHVTVRGTVAGQEVAMDVPVDFERAQKRSAIGTLWARARIEEMSRAGNHQPGDDTVELMTRLALDYRLMSQWTSFVAVADSVVNEGGHQQHMTVPLPMPRGVSPAALGGGTDKIMAKSVVWAAQAPTAPNEGGSSEMRSVNVVDAILAGGGGTMSKGKMASGDRMSGRGGVGFGFGGTSNRTRISPPKPMDMELGGETGVRTPESILRVIRQHLGGWNYTCQKYLREHPDVTGKISLKFTIAASGDIVAIQVVASTTGAAELDEAIRDKARRMKFDAIEKGNVTVTYVFELTKS